MYITCIKSSYTYSYVHFNSSVISIYLIIYIYIFLIFAHFLLYIETPSCEQVESKQSRSPQSSDQNLFLMINNKKERFSEIPPLQKIVPAQVYLQLTSGLTSLRVELGREKEYQLKVPLNEQKTFPVGLGVRSQLVWKFPSAK